MPATVTSHVCRIHLHTHIAIRHHRRGFLRPRLETPYRPCPPPHGVHASSILPPCTDMYFVCIHISVPAIYHVPDTTRVERQPLQLQHVPAPRTNSPFPSASLRTHASVRCETKPSYIHIFPAGPVERTNQPRLLTDGGRFVRAVPAMFNCEVGINLGMASEGFGLHVQGFCESQGGLCLRYGAGSS